MTTTTTPLHDLGVCQIAAAVAETRLSPLDLVNALLERIDRLEGQIQAWSYLDKQRVLDQAARLTEEAEAGRIRGPLHGVPFGAKEQFAVAGMPQKGDPNLPATPPSPEDATCVARLQAAGAIPLGKLYMVGKSGTPPTRNPWNLNHTPGGSSSGSGASVGARMVPFALAEQTAGSGLRPGAYCGVQALKPSFGRVSRYGMFALSYSHDHPCINGRSMADIARVFSVIAGADPKDPTSIDQPTPPGDLDLSHPAPPRIGIVRNFFPERTQPVMQESLEQAAAQLKGAGAQIVDILLPEEFGLAWAGHMLVNGPENHVIYARRVAEAQHSGQPQLPPMKMKGLLPHSLAALVPASYYLQAQRIRRWLATKVMALYEQVDVLLMATAPGPAPAGIQSSGDWSLLQPWSYLGFPAISLSSGLSPEGLPLGIQLVGATWQDSALLQIGGWCESVLGVLPPPPQFP